jgi:hypothetical protein
MQDRAILKKGKSIFISYCRFTRNAWHGMIFVIAIAFSCG